MAVTLRMARAGTNRRPFYHIVAADARRPRDGRFLERLGFYDPRGETQLALNEERARVWLGHGAYPSPAVKRLLKRVGIQ